MAKGDFTGGLDIDQQDEIGRLATSLKHTQADLSRMFGATIEEVVSLSSSSNSLFGVSRQLTEGAEEMTATVKEIAGNSEKGRSITNEAATKAEGASTKVNELGAAATQISKVTETEAISQVIRSVDDIVSSIATAVEQQAATPQEIAENVAQASQGIGPAI